MPLRMPSVNILQKYCPASKVVCMSKIYLQTYISYMLIKFKLCWVPGSPGLLGPCQRLVPGGRPVAGSAGPCLWSSHLWLPPFGPLWAFGWSWSHVCLPPGLWAASLQLPTIIIKYICGKDTGTHAHCKKTVDSCICVFSYFLFSRRSSR